MVPAASRLKHRRNLVQGLLKGKRMKKLVLILTIFLVACEHKFEALSCDVSGCQVLIHRMSEKECARFIEQMQALPNEAKKALLCRDVGP